MVEMDTQTHTCQALEAASVNIWQGEDGEWQLIFSRNASDDDIEANHYLEYEGQTIEQVILTVSYCPTVVKSLWTI